MEPAASHDAASRSGEWSEASAGEEVEGPQGPAQPVTLYMVLGVNITASAEAIRSAYRRLARLWHPDRHQGDEGAKRKFQEVQGAYEVLSDQARRHEYDLNLLEHLDVEEYLSRFQGLILTACGLGMSSRRESLSQGLPEGWAPVGIDTPKSHPHRVGWCLLKAS